MNIIGNNSEYIPDVSSTLSVVELLIVHCNLILKGPKTFYTKTFILDILNTLHYLQLRLQDEAK